MITFAVTSLLYHTFGVTQHCIDRDANILPWGSLKPPPLWALTGCNKHGAVCIPPTVGIEIHLGGLPMVESRKYSAAQMRFGLLRVVSQLEEMTRHETCSDRPTYIGMLLIAAKIISQCRNL